MTTPQNSDAKQPANSNPWLANYPVDIDWNADIKQGTMNDMFAESVKKYADKTCLHFLGKDYTFTEVDAMATRFAAALQAQGIVAGTKVGLSLPNTPFYPIAYFGIMKAGGTVVNFNPTYAAHEVRHQIKDSEAEMMVTINVPETVQTINTIEEMMTEDGKLKKVIQCDLSAALPPVKKTGLRVINGFKNFMNRIASHIPNSVLTDAPEAGKSPGVFIRNKFHAIEKNLKTKYAKPGSMPMKDDASHLLFSDMVDFKGALKPVTVTADDIAVLQYTGGTTGVPKAAMLTHGNLTANIQQAQMWFQSGAKASMDNEKMLAVLPFFHVFSMTIQMNMSIALGWELIMLPKPDMKMMLETMTDKKPTMFAGVPTLYKKIMESPMLKGGKYDLSSMRLCFSGGAPMNATTRDGWKALTGVDIVEGYGLSETSPLATANPVHGEKTLNSVGMPVPQTQVRICDIDTPETVIAPDQTGEICFSGPQIMKGYYNRPDETEKSIDKDGFFHTGDIGHLTAQGLFITGRKKEMIIVNGLKVFPFKLEEAILKHPDVSEVIVLGLPEEKTGEVAKAYIVMHEGKTWPKAEMDAFMKAHLAPYEIPKYVDFRDSLPKTMIGKPDKKVLLAEEKAKAQNAPKPPKAPAP